MIFCLGAVFQQTKIPVDISGGRCHYLDEFCRADVIGTGASDEQPARSQHLQGSEVQFFVSPEGSLQVPLAFGKSWRIEHDAVVLPPGSGVVSEQVESVGFNPLDLAPV